jgi:hypothetical protein
MSDEITVIQANTTDLVYQQDKALVDMQIATAKTYPRDLKKALANSIAIVTLDKETAQTCHYSLPRSGKSISGPSVNLAKILAQNWGNLRVEAKIVDIGQKQITSQAVAFDLENNLAIKVEVKRSIMTRNGRMNDDMITVTGNAANAISLRNAVFAVIPKNVVDKVYNSALQTITGDLSDENKFIAQRKALVEFFFKQYGVTETEVLTVFGKPEITNLTKEDLVTLHGIGTSLKEGDTTIEETFRKNNVVKDKPKDERSDTLKFIEEEAKSVEALLQVQSQLKTDEEILAFQDKLQELSEAKKEEPKTSDGSLIEDEKPTTNV